MRSGTTRVSTSRNGPMTEFPHLYPAAGTLAALGAEDRIRRIRADRWVSYPRAEAALAKLETLMSFPGRARMPNLLLVGESGMGKTMIIEKLARDHAAGFDARTGRLQMPVVAVQMVSGPDEARFYRRLLAVIGTPEPPRATLAVVESLALRVLKELRPRLLVIDEIHSLQAGTIREQARFLNMLRFLGNELRIPLVCVGTVQARNALRTDDQLVRRFEAFALPPWREGEDFTGLITTLARGLPLRRESELDAKALERIIRVTGGITAGIFSIVSQLAIAAIESGEERIASRDVLGGDRLMAALGEPV
ncbi:MAG: TniB family NTP-binding protein [Pseudomonadota bacterium]